MPNSTAELTDCERDEFVGDASAICWDEVLSYTQQQVMMGIVSRALASMPADLAPSTDMLCNLIFQTVQIKERNLLMEKRCHQISQYFANKGFHTMVLKGQGLAQYYPEFGIRASGDIDLWVWQEGLSLSQNRRKLICYINQLMAEHGMPTCQVNYHHIDFPIIKDTEVEVHFTPGLFHNPYNNRHLQRFFRYHQSIAEKQLAEANLRESKYSVPSLRMNIPFIIGHTFRHLLSEGIGLRQVIDCYVVLQAFSHASSSEREAVIVDLRRLGLLGFTKDIIGALALFLDPGDWMIVEPDFSHGISLLKEMLNAGNFGKKNNVSRQNDNRIFYALKITKLQGRYLFRYTSEVLWSPLFRAWHVAWRIINGYRY